MAEVSVQQQIFESINKANRILIPLPLVPNGDCLAAALALRDFLKKLDKEPLLVSLGGLPEKYSFFPKADTIQNKINQCRGFVISVKTEKVPLDELSYHLDEEAETVHIYLKPRQGHYEPADVSFKSDKFPYDLIIVLDTPSLDLLGRLYDENTDLFFETPIINIDHHVNNEHFGEINLIDVTATSTAEILVELLESFEEGLIDPDIATNLLAGILIETNSFQNIKTTPKAFLKASTLVSLGADQQDIIKHLYKTKSVSLLKLWGRGLARLREVPDLGLAYTLLKADDLTKSGSQDIQEVMEELVVTPLEAKIIMLLAEVRDKEVTGYVYVHPSLSALGVLDLLSAEVSSENMGRFNFLGKTLGEVEAEVLTKLGKLKQKMGKL